MCFACTLVSRNILKKHAAAFPVSHGQISPEKYFSTVRKLNTSVKINGCKWQLQSQDDKRN